MNEVRIGGSLVVEALDTPTRKGEYINLLQDIYDITTPYKGMKVFCAETGMVYVVTELTEKIINGVAVTGAMVKSFIPLAYKGDVEALEEYTKEKVDKLDDVATIRFSRILEGTVNVAPDKVENPAEIVFYKAGGKFVAKNAQSKYFDEWDGKEAYMKNGELRKDCVYMSEGSFYMWNGTTLVLDVELTNEIARAQGAEATLQANITAEAERAKAAEQAEKTRAMQAEGVLRGGTTQRFGSVEETTKNIMQGAHDFTLAEVVYYKLGKMFVAKGKDGNLYDTWEGMDAYMSGGAIRKDKVYICGGALYVWNGTDLVDVTAELKQQFAELIGEAPDALDSIHEIADWILNDKTGAAAMATQISQNKSDIAAEKSRAEGAEEQLGNDISAEEERATEKENALQESVNAEIARANEAETTLQANIDAEAARAQAAEEELNSRKADEGGYHPKMTTGFSDNLVGRGEAVEAQFTYRPTGGTQSIEDGVARIERIKGCTIVWNQLAKIQETTTFNGVTIESLGDGSYKVYAAMDTPLTSDVLFPVTDPLTKAQKVLFRGAPSTPTTAGYSLKAETAGVYDTGAGAVISSTSESERICIFIAAGTTINTAVTFHPQVFELTRMFGVGKEPSIEEFKVMYPNKYEYNDGELISLTAEGIKSVGFNAFNPEEREIYIPEKGYGPQDSRYFSEKQIWNGVSVTGYASSSRAMYTDIKITSHSISAIKPSGVGVSGYGIGFPVRLLADTTYYVKAKIQKGNYQLGFFDNNGKYISSATTLPFTTPSNCTWGLFVCLTNETSEKAEVFIKDININISHTGYRNGELEDYKSFTSELPIKEQFPEGMKSAGDAYDEILKERAIKRIGTLDLGECNWHEIQCIDDNSRYYYHTDVLTDAVMGGGIVSTHFKQSEMANVTYGSKNTNACLYNNRLYVVHKDFNTLSTTQFKMAMSGVKLYYELSQPEETIFTDPLNLNYEVSDFGTEEAVMSDFSAPFRADIVYGFNAVDTIRSNRTMIAELLARIEALEGK